MTNILAEEYRRRIDWIEDHLLEMTDEHGHVLRVDAERIIFQAYRCTRNSVRRYLETLEGAGVIRQNSTHLIMVAKEK